ncbi:MAG: patatin-like phospholipase family protein [Chloroflexota bacterium]
MTAMSEQTPSSVSDGEKRVDLVFEGGGVKGIALVGALSVLQEQGFEVQRTAGTSAGAIVATLCAAGYNAPEIHDLIANQDFTQFTDPTTLDRIPVVGQGLNVLRDKGIYLGRYFHDWMREKLSARRVITFGDLRASPPSDDPRYTYKVQVIASDTTGRCLLVLPKDVGKLGVDDPDDLEVALAVRMSMSIPVFFEPVQFLNPKTRQHHTIVDGGILSNFPVWLFDSDGPPRWPTFGLKLVEADPKTSLADSITPKQPHGPIEETLDYIKSLVETMTGAHDRQYLAMDQFVRTITIPTLGISSTQFTLSKQQTDALFQSGRDAAESFLQGWYGAGGFPAYVAAFRSNDRPTRRQTVLEHMRQAAAPHR